jgi:hypothetical protein
VIAHANGGKAKVFAHFANTNRPLADIDTLAQDGVGCTVCHQIAPGRLGTRASFNGNFVVAAALSDGLRQAFGPLAVDAGRRRIMHSVTGFVLAEAPHVREWAVCATCYTLITEALGPEGQVISSLPEQMNYQEWRHSSFRGHHHASGINPLGADLGAQGHQPGDRALTERRLRHRHPLAELVTFGRSAVITVRPTPSLEKRADVQLVPLPDGRAMISFSQTRTIPELELTLNDAVEDPSLEADDRQLFEAIVRILKDARRSHTVVVQRRSIIVLESSQRPRSASRGKA